MSDELPVPLPEVQESEPKGQAVSLTVSAIFAAIMMVLALIGAGVTLANVTWADE